MDELHQKLERLREHLKKTGRCAVAFSSGVDSAFLLKTAHDVLGDTKRAKGVPNYANR